MLRGIVPSPGPAALAAGRRSARRTGSGTVAVPAGPWDRLWRKAASQDEARLPFTMKATVTYGAPQPPAPPDQLPPG